MSALLTSMLFLVPIGNGKTIEAHGWREARVINAIVHHPWAKGVSVERMLAVIQCESGFDPHQMGRIDPLDTGLIQYHMDAAHIVYAAQAGYLPSDLLKVEPSLDMADHLLKDFGWKTWHCGQTVPRGLHSVGSSLVTKTVAHRQRSLTSRNLAA